MPKDDGKVQCQLCGQRYKQITASHLAQMHPGMSLEKYKEVYGATTAKQLALATIPKEVLSPVAKQLVEQIISDESLVRDLTAKIGEGLFGQAMRGITTKALVTLLHTNLSRLEAAAQNVGRVNSELFEEWRLKSGRDDGGPTPTHELVKIGQLAQMDLRDVAESILRLGQMAVLDGHRNVGPNIQVQVFSGEHEKVVMPEGLTPQRREMMRLFASKFTRPERDIEAIVKKARALRDAEHVEVEIDNGSSDTGGDGDELAE